MKKFLAIFLLLFISGCKTYDKKNRNNTDNFCLAICILDKHGNCEDTCK